MPVPAHPTSRLGQCASRRAQQRRAIAVEKARHVLIALAAVGVDARIIGSLAKGGFDVTSDIDVLVIECPQGLKYRIEHLIEDILEGLPFDVIYVDEIPPHRIVQFMEGAVDARHLC